jgi:hypothetical protein
MLFPPTSILLLLHEPPTPRPVYDIPPVISYQPRWPRLRALAARVARGGRTAPRADLTPGRSVAARVARDRVRTEAR